MESFLNFLLMLYTNFSFPILLLIFIFTFKKQIRNFISNLIESEFKFGDNSINLKRRIDESKKEIESEYGEELEVAKENIREQTEKLFGKKYNQGIPIDNSGGGGGPPLSSDPHTVATMQFAILHSEKELKEIYEKYGWQSAIVSLYLAYLSLRERDKISRRVEDYTDKMSDRDLQIEEKSFRTVTDLYIHALKNDSDKNRWSWLEIKSYQQLIQIVIVPFDLNINSLPTKSEEEDLFS